MKKRLLFFLMIAVLCMAWLYPQPVFSQDPGLPDSLCIGWVSVPFGGYQATVPVWIKTDEPIAFLNFPIHYISPDGNIRMTHIIAEPPLNAWDDVSDSVNTAVAKAYLLGFADLGGENNPWLNTNYQWQLFCNLHFFIQSSAIDQLVFIDSSFFGRNGSMLFGDSASIVQIYPAFRGGGIAYGAVGINPDPNIVPTNYALQQNYPNPFNGYTVIQFSVPEQSHISLTVYNIVGQKVITLIDEDRPAGTYSATWNANALPSGVYFYQLHAGTYAQTLKMTLVK